MDITKKLTEILTSNSSSNLASVPVVSGTDCPLVRAFDSLSLHALRHQHDILSRIQSAQKTTLFYQQEHAQEQAREIVPIEKLHSEAHALVSDSLAFGDALMRCKIF